MGINRRYSLVGLSRIELEHGWAFTSSKSLSEWPETAEWRNEYINYVVHPTRIAKILRMIQVPPPELWTNLTTMVYNMTTETGYR